MKESHHSGLSSPSVLALPHTVPIFVWDECTFNSTAEVRICLSPEPIKPEGWSSRNACSIIASIAVVLTFITLAAAIAVPLSFLAQSSNDALQVRRAGSGYNLVAIPLHVEIVLTVGTEKQPGSPASSGAAGCISGDGPLEHFRFALEDAFRTTLQVLGAPGIDIAIADVACNGTSTTLSMLEIDVQGADFATAVARALQSTQAQRRLESLLVDSLQAQDLVINQLIVDEPDLG